jgi:hypothetical protein
MNKKLIIAFVIVGLGWFGFMTYRSHRSASEEATRATREYQRATSLALKSPSSGLSLMGGALQSYFADNGEYPAKLIQLHPQYIPHRPFIEDIEWSYTPFESDFYLGKTVILNKRPMTASIDSELRPDIETGTLVAEEDATDPRLLAKLAKPLTIDDLGAPLDETVFKEKVVASLADQAIPNLGGWEASSGPEQFLDPALIIGKETQYSSISRIGDTFLVWKYRDGIKGFGNVQYPKNSQIAVLSGRTWSYLTPPSDAPDEDSATFKANEAPFATPVENAVDTEANEASAVKIEIMSLD